MKEEKRRFITASNNSTTAMIREDHAWIYGRVKAAGGKPELAVRVFTFVTPGSSMLEFATGTTDDMKRLLELGGYETISASEAGDSGWDGNVPFSNGHEIAEQHELGFRTTLSDVLQLFLADSKPPYSGSTLRS